MTKIIFSDFDNTMLDYYSDNNYFDDYKINVLKRVQNKGIKLGIVTGRCVSFFNQFPNLLEVVDYIAGSNGACIYDVKNDKYIYKDVIEVEDFRSIVDWAYKYNISFLLNCMGKRYRFGTWDVSNCEIYSKDKDYSCEQIILSVNKEIIKEVFAYLDNLKSIKINNISYWENRCTIDINNKIVSKGRAVTWLCNHLNIEVKDTMAFGDGDNDKSMFEVVDKGIAVGNAIDKLKVMSNDVALSCDENGIYKYMEDKFLK